MSAVLVLVAAVAVHQAALSFGFVMDDWPQIAENPGLATLGLSELFGRGTWANTKFTALAADVYRPVFSLYLSILARLGGFSPVAFHLGNLAIHAGASLMMLGLARRLSDDGTVATAAGLLFAVHPIHAANVGWISASADSLAGLFTLIAAVCWLDWRRRGGGPRLAGAVLACLAAALSKETGLLAPAALVLIELASGPWRAIPRWAVAAVWIGPVLAMIGRGLALGGGGAEFGLELSGPNLGRLADILAYTPQGLAAGTPQPYYFGRVPEGFATWLAAPSALLLAAAAWAAPRRLALIGLGWLGLFLLPALLLAFDRQSAFATRMLYLPSAGAALILAGGLGRLGPRLARPVLAAAALGLGGLAVHHLEVWRDDGAFYRHVTASSPASASGYAGLARHHLRDGDIAAAEAVYTAATTMVAKDSDRLSLVESHALLLAEQGRLAEAAGRFQLLAEQPLSRAEGLVGLGKIAWAQGDLVRAAALFRQTLAEFPRNAEARAGLAAVTRPRP